MAFSSEAILCFVLLVRLRNTLRTFAPHPVKERWLKTGMVAVVLLLVIEGALHTAAVTGWIWHLALFYVIGLPFREADFSYARTTMYAVLPFAVFTVISNSAQTLFPSLKSTVSTYEDYALPVAFTWMLAMLVLSHKQMKALREEHRKRMEEEAERRQIAARKTELEILVAERTAELLQQKEELQHALRDLKATQTQLIQREKMASLGELTAGIAHEIQNPLNFINNFSELNLELTEEVREFVDGALSAEKRKTEAVQLLDNLMQNLQKIVQHGKRADSIVKGMLQHSRRTSHGKNPVNVNALVEEYLRLAYHGLRAKDKLFHAIIETHFDPGVEDAVLNSEEIGRVLLNLFNNAFYALNERAKKGEPDFEPLLQVSTKRKAEKIEIKIKDNGTGIPQNILDKIYQPFFTTKPTGEGTGLGLSLSYDIVTKGHGGEINVNTQEGRGTEFTVVLNKAAKTFPEVI